MIHDKKKGDDCDPVLSSRSSNGVVRVVLNQPGTRNALSRRMIDSLTGIAETLMQDESVRAVMLSGRGSFFCAGGDLDWMRAQFDAPLDECRRQATALAQMLDIWSRLPKFVVATVVGGAFGGGAGLLSIADSVIAEDGSRFGFPEGRLGLIPATIAPHVVARIGAAQAVRLFVTGRMIDAAEARDIALLSRIVPVGGLVDAAEEEIENCLACAPGAVAAAKRLVHDIRDGSADSGIESMVERLVERWKSQEAQEGISAFFDKRKPDWNPSDK